MKFKVVIDCDGAAFADSVEGHELARILRELADKMQSGEGPHPFIPTRARQILRDINGNPVGKASYPREPTCPQCDGDDDACYYCRGRGTVTEEHAAEWHRQNS